MSFPSTVHWPDVGTQPGFISVGLGKAVFLKPQMVKNMPAMQEIWVQSLGWGDPLEKGMATHSSILAWKIPRTADPSPQSHRDLGTTE